jgi:hypothetical protein
MVALVDDDEIKLVAPAVEARLPRQRGDGGDLHGLVRLGMARRDDAVGDPRQIEREADLINELDPVHEDEDAAPARCC